MNPLALILLILVIVISWVWGFMEGRDRPTRTARQKMTEQALDDLRQEADNQIKKLGLATANSRKEEIYLRFVLVTYIQDQIKELPDYKGTSEEALKLAIRIAKDLYKQYRPAFDNNFKEGIEQASMDIANGKTGIDD